MRFEEFRSNVLAQYPDTFDYDIIQAYEHTIPEEEWDYRKEEEEEKPAPQQNTTFFQDTKDLVDTGFYGLAESAGTAGEQILGKGGVSSDLREWGSEGAEEQQEQLTPETRDALNKMGIDPEDEISVRGTAAMFLQSAPMMFGYMIPGAGIAKGLNIAGKAAGILNKASKTGVFEKVLGYGTAGAGLIGGDSASTVGDGLRLMPDKDLYEDPQFQEFYKQTYKGEDPRAEFDAAKDLFIEYAESDSFKKGAAVGFAGSAVAGPLLEKIFRGGMYATRLKNMVAGGVIESGQEIFEEGGQATVEKQYLPETNVPERMVLGGLLGAVGGTAFGGIPTPVKQNSKDPVFDRSTIPEVVTDPDGVGLLSEEENTTFLSPTDTKPPPPGGGTTAQDLPLDEIDEMFAEARAKQNIPPPNPIQDLIDNGTVKPTTPDNLEAMDYFHLRAKAKEAGVSTKGNKEQVIEQIRAQQEVTANTEPTAILSEPDTINMQGAQEVTAQPFTPSKDVAGIEQQEQLQKTQANLESPNALLATRAANSIVGDTDAGLVVDADETTITSPVKSVIQADRTAKKQKKLSVIKSKEQDEQLSKLQHKAKQAKAEQYQLPDSDAGLVETDDTYQAIPNKDVASIEQQEQLQKIQKSLVPDTTTEEGKQLKRAQNIVNRLNKGQELNQRAATVFINKLEATGNKLNVEKYSKLSQAEKTNTLREQAEEYIANYPQSARATFTNPSKIDMKGEQEVTAQLFTPSESEEDTTVKNRPAAQAKTAQEFEEIIESFDGNGYATFRVEDWGKMQRGQGKRVGGMVRGSMSDAPRGKKTYTDPIGKLPEAERQDVIDLVLDDNRLKLFYLKAKNAGLDHETSLDYMLKEEFKGGMNEVFERYQKRSNKVPTQTAPEVETEVANKPTTENIKGYDFTPASNGGMWRKLDKFNNTTGLSLTTQEVANKTGQSIKELDSYSQEKQNTFEKQYSGQLAESKKDESKRVTKDAQKWAKALSDSDLKTFVEMNPSGSDGGNSVHGIAAHNELKQRPPHPSESDVQTNKETPTFYVRNGKENRVEKVTPKKELHLKDYGIDVVIHNSIDGKGFKASEKTTGLSLGTSHYKSVLAATRGVKKTLKDKGKSKEELQSLIKREFKKQNQQSLKDEFNGIKTQPKNNDTLRSEVIDGIKVYEGYHPRSQQKTWFTQNANNVGTENTSGDSIHDNKEDAIATAKAEALDIKSKQKAKVQAEQQEKEQVAQKERDDSMEDYRGFAADKSAMVKARARKTLSVKQRVGLKTLSRKEFIEQKIKDGYTVETVETQDNKAERKLKQEIDYLIKQGYANFGNQEHPKAKRYNEISKLLEDGVKTKVKRLTAKDGSFYEATKTEMDYAEHLIQQEKKSTKDKGIVLDEQAEKPLSTEVKKTPGDPAIKLKRLVVETESVNNGEVTLEHTAYSLSQSIQARYNNVIELKRCIG